MKLAFAVLLLVGVALAAEYTTKYDGVNLDEILKSERLLNNYFKCLMDQGRCTPDGTELKKTLPDALKTECSKCSEKQREGTEKVLRYLIKNKPKQWAELQKKYDSEGIYFKKYENEAKSKGIEV